MRRRYEGRIQGKRVGVTEGRRRQGGIEEDKTSKGYIDDGKR